MKEFDSGAQQLALYLMSYRGNRPNMGTESHVSTLANGNRVLLSAGTIYRIDALPLTHSELSPTPQPRRSK